MVEFESLVVTCGPFINNVRAEGYYNVNDADGLLLNNNDDRKISAEDSVRADCIQTTLKKTADKSFAEVGDAIKYTITFTNHSSVDMYGVKVINTISPKTTLVQGSINLTPQVGETLETGVTIGDIPKGTSKALEFVVTVNPGETADIFNRAIGTFKFKDWKGIEHTGETDPADATTKIVSAKLEIIKDADKTYITHNGEEVVYTLTIKNNGDVKITNIVVTDIIPTGMLYKANSTLKNDMLPYTNESPQNGINIGDLNAGAFYKIQFTVIVSV